MDDFLLGSPTFLSKTQMPGGLQSAGLFIRLAHPEQCQSMTASWQLLAAAWTRKSSSFTTSYRRDASA